MDIGIASIKWSILPNATVENPLYKVEMIHISPIPVISVKERKLVLQELEEQARNLTRSQLEKSLENAGTKHSFVTNFEREE